MPAVIDLTQSQAFTALRAFLLSVLPAGTEVDQTQVNRVIEPVGSNFVMMTPLRQERLSWNGTSYLDNVFTGAIAGTTLSVLAVAQSEGSGILPGMVLTDGFNPNVVLPNTTIISQVNGTPGGEGDYIIAPVQNLGEETLYAGQRQDVTPTKWVVQLDFYGPASGEYVKIVDTLFCSSVATDFFSAQGYPVQALYTDEARQAAFISGEQQFQQRWTMDVALEIDPTVGTSIQFFDEVEVAVVEAAPNYTGP